MDSLIFNPLDVYEKVLSQRHKTNAEAFFEALQAKSGIQIEENRATVAKYNAQQAKADQVMQKARLYKTLRVFAIIATVLSALLAVEQFYCSQALPGILLLLAAGGLLALWLWKLNPLIKNLKALYEKENAAAQALLQACWQQMAPLNNLFTNWDGITLTERTVPSFCFQPHLPVMQEKNMTDHFDLPAYEESEQTVLDTLSGTYNDNPFLYERRRIHAMGTETYHGYKTIHWTEHYTDSKGRHRSRSRSQTLHATVTKPKPFYRTETRLHYGAQAGPDLNFSRENRHLEDKSERAIDSMVRKGEKKLQQKAEDALENNRNFMGMSNTEFDVLFDALDRDHEVQFRLLFTPLAQTNMLDLIRSETGYGEDFDFYKRRRMNTIVSEHNQSWSMLLEPDSFRTYDYDALRRQFLAAHQEYFKSIYFDFAPLLAVPAYQERPTHSLPSLPEKHPKYSMRECEVLANAMDASCLAHPGSRTPAIMKASHKASGEGADTVCITAHSYRTVERVDLVAELGGDGRFHQVPVPWQQYIPVETTTDLLVSSSIAQGQAIQVQKHGLYARVIKSEE